MSRVVFTANLAPRLAVALFVACAGCGRGAPPPPPAAEPAAAVAMRGELTHPNGHFAFRACGAPDSTRRPLSGETGELDTAWATLAPGGDRPMYVELRGAPSPDGSSIVVASLERARPAGEASGCDRPVFDGDFVATGNEPFWTIEIGRDAIVYRSPEEPKGRRFPYAAIRQVDGSVEYAAKLDAPKVSTLAITIRPRRCVDGMSGELRAFTASVELDGRKLEGCAAAGVPAGGFGDDPLDELERYLGSYPNASGLWSIEPWGSRLTRLLGEKRAVFDANMQVRGPLMKDAGVYYVLGNAPHEGGSDAAIFLADPAADAIEVILVEKSVRTDFNETDRDVKIPAEASVSLQTSTPR